jgi:SAM-dependent methyltransferase
VSTVAANHPHGEIKLCCATFYESEIARLLLGDVFHPGGLALTEHLGVQLGLGEADHILDVACGRGTSAVHLAAQFGCHVIGLDYSPENLDAARSRARERGVDRLVTFRQGDAEELPFDDRTFDALISECSFCTFPDKATASAEMARVLRPGGQLGLTDVVVQRTLPDDVQSLLAWVACVAGAGTTEDYVTTLRQAGFVDLAVEDQHGALLALVNDVRRKLFGIELAAGLGKLDLGDLDLDEAKRLARRAVEWIEDQTVGYTLITARKKGVHTW